MLPPQPAALPSRHVKTTRIHGAPTAADVDTAARRLAGVALRTPLISSPVLDAATGARVFLKAETLQRTGSFKFRGAYNKLSSLPQDKRAGGVVAFSSGNHAQGVAAAAKLLDMSATIVMPSDAPKPKRDRTAALGAEVVLYNRDTEDREGIARAIAEKRGATLVPPYDDPFIIAGQGTAGREIMEDLGALGLTPDVVVIGASGGGLAAGISLAIKARAPDAKIYTAEPEGFDDTARSFRSGKHEKNARMSGTICDALMSNTPGQITFAINRKLIGEGFTASDEEVARAVSFAFRELKLVVEPGGAIGLAALLAGRVDVKGKVVVAVLSGGNVDPELFHRLVALRAAPGASDERKQRDLLFRAQCHERRERIARRRGGTHCRPRQFFQFVVRNLVLGRFFVRAPVPLFGNRDLDDGFLDRLQRRRDLLHIA